MDEVTFLFREWETIARIALIGVSGYVALLVLVRASGTRTLGQLTPFDAIITVTLGSAFGRVLTAENVGLVEVLATFLVLVMLQWTAAVLQQRVPSVGKLLRPPPLLLLHRGDPLPAAMRRQRVTETDLFTAARESGLGSLAEAEAIILEPDGSFSVITSSQVGDGSALPQRLDG